MSETKEFILNQNNPEKLNPNELEGFLLSDEFSANLVEAIRQTEQDPDTECAFIGFRTPDAKDGALYLSPVYKGTPERLSKNLSGGYSTIGTSVGMDDYSLKYMDKNLRTDDNPFEFLFVHTHPGLTNLDRASELTKEIFGERPGEKPSKPLPYDRFSDGDLNFFKYNNTRFPNFLLGVVARDVDQAWRLIIISANKHTQDFDPKSVFDTSVKNQKKGRSPEDAYRKVGLNTASIRIDINSDSPLNAQDTTQASRVLTRR